MNPFTLAQQVQDDYQRFIWTAYPVADPELRKQLDRLVQQEALLWRGPYVTVQQPVRVAGSVADLVAAERMPEAVVRGSRGCAGSTGTKSWRRGASGGASTRSWPPGPGRQDRAFLLLRPGSPPAARNARGSRRSSCTR